MKDKKNKAVCFGEILWDIFPGEQKRVGGAPFNVAYHLSRMGIDANMISSVGNDQLGRDLLEKMKNWNIPTDHVQINTEYPTSTVIATVDEHNDAHYDIVEDVAWDFIEATKENKEILNSTDALVFGTLAARKEETRNTLFQLLEISHYNVFDINLREPYYEVGMIKDLLHKTHLAKFNKAEMRMMLDFLGKDYTTEEDGIKYLQDKFDLEEIIISKGSKGALYANQDKFYLYPTIPVTIKDTVGSGDSFLAGFLSKRLEKGSSVHEIMTQAVSLGAFITSQEGACPEYSLEDFIRFKNEYPLSALR
ncbi:carbohydrate kinase family protein [Chryseobacterium jejuense]|uniref:Fructokinase n=1 Tax=Chryseobacterium jejuense TaxID=445960 RepID=A0A2X2Z7N9_CHRJE|nr:carbohydrate kinase [Chryseobacterium jejuense]SDI13212.1 fructokinase [Chryseobacterium jejuense]SQB46440.1 Fructosamine kinase frlD [Chryseobacterium jejuense]